MRLAIWPELLASVGTHNAGWKLLPVHRRPHPLLPLCGRRTEVETTNYINIIRRGILPGATSKSEVMPGTDSQRRGSEVRFEEIAIDLLQARLWIASIGVDPPEALQPGRVRDARL